MGVVNSSSTLPKLFNVDNRLRASFEGNYFKQDKIDYFHGPVINIYIVYRLDKIKTDRNTDFTIQNALFGAMKITKDAYESHNQYRGYGICFDSSSSNFSFGNRIDAKNVIIFGVDMSFSTHKRNESKSIFVLGKDFIQGVTTIGPTAIAGSTTKGTTINAEKMYKTNFTEPDKKIVLSLHCNGDNDFNN